MHKTDLETYRQMMADIAPYFTKREVLFIGRLQKRRALLKRMYSLKEIFIALVVINYLREV